MLPVDDDDTFVTALDNSRNLFVEGVRSVKENLWELMRADCIRIAGDTDAQPINWDSPSYGRIRGQCRG
jgi:hypothetical protein